MMEPNINFTVVGKVELPTKPKAAINKKPMATRCFYCKCIVHNFGKGFKRRTYDHVTPKSKGGTKDNYNIVISCSGCNNLKTNLSLESFLALLNMLLEEIKSRNRKHLYFHGQRLTLTRIEKMISACVKRIEVAPQVLDTDKTKLF